MEKETERGAVMTVVAVSLLLVGVVHTLLKQIIELRWVLCVRCLLQHSIQPQRVFVVADRCHATSPAHHCGLSSLAHAALRF